MKSVPLLMALLLLAGSSKAASMEGIITLNCTKSNSSELVFKKEFGNVLKATSNWRVENVIGMDTVFAGVTVKNTGTKRMWFQYCVAFYDGDKKLVGTASQSLLIRSGLRPGKATQVGPSRFYLPKGKYKDIVWYQALLYETDRPPQRNPEPMLLEDP